MLVQERQGETTTQATNVSAPALDVRFIIGEQSIDKSAVNPPSIIAK